MFYIYIYKTGEPGQAHLSPGCSFLEECSPPSPSAACQPSTVLRKWKQSIFSRRKEKFLILQAPDVPGFLPAPTSTTCSSLCDYLDGWPRASSGTQGSSPPPPNRARIWFCNGHSATATLSCVTPPPFPRKHFHAVFKHAAISSIF